MGAVEVQARQRAIEVCDHIVLVLWHPEKLLPLGERRVQ